MTTFAVPAAAIVASAERFTLTTFKGHGCPGAKIGTFVHHGWDEAQSINGSLHQVIVTPVDDETVRVFVSLNGYEVRLDDLDVFRANLTTAVEAHVAAFLSTQVASA